MNLYELNKGLVNSLPDLSKDEIENLILIINSWRHNNYHNVDTLMLLGRELNYYTLFRWRAREYETLGEVVVDCLNNIGKIKTWDITSDNKAVELWVESEAIGPSCLYLFPYDDAIVHFGG